MFVGSFELKLTEQCEGKNIKPHPQPNSVFAQFSVLCIFNWMLGQLRKTMRRSFFEGRSYIRERTPNLNRLNRARKHLALRPIQYSRNSQSYIYSIRCSAN